MYAVVACSAAVACVNYFGLSNPASKSDVALSISCSQALLPLPLLSLIVAI